jgi:amino acid transporter
MRLFPTNRSENATSLRSSGPGEHAARTELRSGVLGIGSSWVIAVASTAPAYSVAATVGLLAGTVGFAAPGVLWLAFVPMFLIAVAYRTLNRDDPDCGTSFAWVRNAAGPHLAWMTGWVMVVADILVVSSLAQIAGLYTLLLVGPGGAHSTAAVTAVGVAWIAAMTAIAVVGIEPSARTQWVLLTIELSILAGFAAFAFVHLANGTGHAATPEASWFWPGGGSTGIGSGLLLAVFMYWGWDTAVSVNEETRAPRTTPGRAALLANVSLLVLYVVVTTAALSAVGVGPLRSNPDDALSFLGARVVGHGFGQLLVLAVLLSAAGSIQTTIVPTARTLLSMGRRRAAPQRLAQIHPRFATPAPATIATGAAAAAWYVGLTIVSKNVLADSIAALGLMIAFYYGATGVVCVLQYRRNADRGAGGVVTRALAPAVGAAIFAYVLVAAFADLCDPANSPTGTEWLGVAAPLVLAGGAALSGVAAMLLWRARHPEFFRRPRSGRPPRVAVAVSAETGRREAR